MRYIGLIAIIIIYAFSIEIKLMPDNNISVNYQDTQVLKNYLYQIYRFRITDKGAYTITKENRILANTYLKRGLLSENDKKYLQVIIEKYLAESFIKKLQREQKLSEKVLFSYYLDNKKQFKEEDKIYFLLLQFPSFNSSLKVYNLLKKLPPKQIIEEIKKDSNISIKNIGWKKFSELKDVTKSFIKKGKKDYFLPPFIIASNRVKILYVKDYQEGKGYKNFNEVKDKIRQILYQKAFVKERNRILHQLESIYE